MTKEEQEALDRVRPLCVECKHHILNTEWDEYQCGRTGSVTACNVTGRIHTKHRECSVERNHNFQNSCGRTGRFFEPKPPKKSWLEAIIAWVN